MGSDLHLALDRSAGLRAGLERALRDAVRSGTLTAGTRLPGSRVLALDLGVARNTVAEVYTQLVHEGYLSSDRGGGTRVAPGAGRVRAQPAVESALPDRRAEPRAHDLRPGRPDVSCLPTRIWLGAIRQVLNTTPREALGYGDPRGPVGAREVIASYLSRVRGVQADPEQIVLCAGYRQAVTLVCGALAARGARSVAVERPGLPVLSEQAERAGLAPIPLAVDGQGAVAADLAGIDPDAAVLTPAHQFPTGVPLAPVRRSEVLAWAHRAGGLVVEDDYDGEFRYDRQAVGSLQGLAPDVVAYAGSASKTLAPGLRLAWLVVPDHLRAAVIREKELTDRHGDNLSALALAVMIESGAYDRHVRAMRLRYKRRRDELTAALEKLPRPLSPRGIAAGLQVVVPLPGDEAGVVRRLAAAGVITGSMSAYAGGVDHEPALVVGYGAPAQHEWPTALRALTDALSGSLARVTGRPESGPSRRRSAPPRLG
jgi:GntR family transcriptional regulator/MocR family aminotransferase